MDEMTEKRESKRLKFNNSIIWIIFVFLWAYLMLGSILEVILGNLFELTQGISSGMIFVLSMYTVTIGAVIAFLIVCTIRKNRDSLDAVIPNKRTRSFYMLFMGLLLGFLMNFFCIVAAMLHGDIILTYDFTASGIPLMIFALLSVFIQSASEEMWTRGFMYERINVHYPLWVAILVNGVIFGLLHLANPGMKPLAMADIIVCGISFSLLRWYSGSIWSCFGVHTMWNFTQNFIFGLPNSGLVSETSIFHMDAANAFSNWVYDYEFGVEGAVPALFVDFLLGAICLYLGWREGRLGELLDSKERTAAALTAETAIYSG